jgi:hypothetical protein
VEQNLFASRNQKGACGKGSLASLFSQTIKGENGKMLNIY